MPDENVRPDARNNAEAAQPVNAGNAQPQQQDQSFRRRMDAALAERTRQAEQTSDNSLNGDVRGENVNLHQGNVTNNYFVLDVLQARTFKDRGARGRAMGMGGADPIVRKLGEAFAARPPDVAFAGEEKDISAQKASKQLPGTLDEIRKWYRHDLNSVERCYVQAVAVLSGAPEHEIKKATRDFYKPLYDAKERHLERMSWARTEDIPDFETFSASVVLEPSFLLKTYTTVRQVERVRRLFWWDAAPNGFSNFAVQVLKLIKEETPIGGAGQQDFLEHLEQLQAKLKGESAWRIPRTLGALWLNEDAEHLKEIANEWVRKQSEGGWWDWRIAHLLDGAYEIECGELGEDIDKADKSIVLRLLYDWTWEAHSSSQAQLQENIGCAVARTYGLIGQSCLQPALAGLDQLLCFPLSGEGYKESIPEDVFICAVFSYVTLARFGSIRKVLTHLASNVERLSHQRKDLTLREPKEYINQRNIMLSATFNTLILLSIVSSGPTNDTTNSMYSRSQRLDKTPKISEDGGKDILLAGLLARGEFTWRRDITTLLSGMLVEDAIEPAFYIMREWAETILRERGAESLDLRIAYIEFMLDVLYQADAWTNELRRSGYQQRHIAIPCRDILRRWKDEARQPPKPLGAFAKDMLKRLDA